jgi:hypothetical protein
MIELVDTMPEINVQPAEYKRLLGYPRGREISERAKELADAARAWYMQHAKPWVYAREVENLALGDGHTVNLDGAGFSSKRLHQTLAQAEAHGAVLVAVGAGAEAEAEAQRLWREEKPDEYFFLEIFGSAVVEHLLEVTGARLCGWSEGRGMAVLPHYSPGYPEWDVSQQPRLLELIRSTRQHPLTTLAAMESGMLRPKKSQLAVFGLTRSTERTRRLTDLTPCENCSLSRCQYRRAPYIRAAEWSSSEAASVNPARRTNGETAARPPVAVQVPLTVPAKYCTSQKALKRWADERLVLQVRDDGSVEALFRYEGTTCSNMGRAIKFDYTVHLGPREQGYPITMQRCEPTQGDDGYRYMCRYMNNAEHLMVAIDQEKPLLGQRLNDVLAWQRPMAAAGCYCEPSSRKHKWGLVLETIHYALAQREKDEQLDERALSPLRASAR